MANAPPVVRMFVLARAMAATRRGVSLREFAKQHGWPQTNIYADFKRLEKAGLEITQVATGRYAISEGAVGSWLDGRDSDELLALYVVKHAMGALGATSVGRNLERLWVRLSRRGHQGSLIPEESGTLSVNAAAAPDLAPHAKTIALLERAIVERRCVRIVYRRIENGEVTERDVEPGFLHVDASLGGLYFVGFCRLRQEVRYFAVQRVWAATLLDQRVPRRAELSVSLQKRAFRLWWRENVVRVIVRFSATVAGEIRERTWHPSQRLRELPGGGVELSIEVGDPRELLRWVMGFGADVEVIEPASLAGELQHAHARASGAPASLLRSGVGRSRSALPKVRFPPDGTPLLDHRLHQPRRRRAR